MLNIVALQGRITKDPELRKTAGGVSVTSFTLAVERDFKENGERKTDFIDIVAWRQTAEFVCAYLGKGRMAAVSGRLQFRDWTDRDGNSRRIAEVQADSVYPMDSRREGGAVCDADNSRSAAVGSGYGRRNGSPSGFSELDETDGELPF
jgi:single-strand DNA-binding protein